LIQLTPTLLDWVYFGRIRGEIVKKQAVFCGLLLDIFCGEVASVVKDDYQLFTELLLKTPQEQRRRFASQPPLHQREKAVAVLGDRTQQIHCVANARDGQSRA